MALWGRSTCVGGGRNLRAAPRALREPRGPSAPGVTLPWNYVCVAEKGGLQPTGRYSLSFLLTGVHQLLGVGPGVAPGGKLCAWESHCGSALCPRWVQSF